MNSESVHITIKEPETIKGPPALPPRTSIEDKIEDDNNAPSWRKLNNMRPNSHNFSKRKIVKDQYIYKLTLNIYSKQRNEQRK